MNPRIGLLLLPLLLIALQAVPETTYWNRGRGYAPFSGATSEGVMLHGDGSSPASDILSFDAPSGRFAFSFRARPGKGGWRVAMPAGLRDTLRICFDKSETWDMTTLRKGYLVSVLWRGAVVASSEVNDGLDCGSGVNGWKITLSDSIVVVHGGNRVLKPLMSFSIPQSSLHTTTPLQATGIGFEVAAKGLLEVTDIVLETDDATLAPATQWTDRYHLSDYLAASTDFLEGYYKIFDSNLDDDLLRMGGDYLLAIVKDNEATKAMATEYPFPDIRKERYMLIYLGGAVVNPGAWTIGMVKGCLHPTPFDGVYDLEWIDATGGGMASGLKAQTGGDGIVTLQFPYQSSVVRLRKAGL